MVAGQIGEEADNQPRPFVRVLVEFVHHNYG
jgi:hypothetical protein